MKLDKILIKSVFLAFVCCISTVSLSSCSESDNDAVVIPGEAESDTYSFTINLPFTGFGSSYTRDDDPKRDPIETEDVRNEGILKDLYLVIYQEDPDYSNGDYNERNYFFYSLSDIKAASGIQNTLNSQYGNNYTLSLPKGKYRFYFLANIYQYWEKRNVDNVNNLAEFEKVLKDRTQIQKLRLSFGNEEINLGNGLPMICMPEEISTSQSNDTKLENGVFVITDDDIKNFQQNNQNSRKTLYAPLTILCSKVRYTVLFDNTVSPDDGYENFSNAFGNPISFTYDEDQQEDQLSGYVTFKNLYKYTTVIPLKEKVSTKETDWVDEIKRFIVQAEYPTLNPTDQEMSGNNPANGENHEPSGFADDAGRMAGKDTSGYFDIKNAQSSPAYLTKLFETDKWENENRRAWQSGSVDGTMTGSVYLPENSLYTYGSNNKTVLHLDAHGEGVKDGGYDIELDLKRGYFYDIVIKMVTSTQTRSEVKVMVNPWIYNSKNVSW